MFTNTKGRDYKFQDDHRGREIENSVRIVMKLNTVRKSKSLRSVYSYSSIKCSLEH